MAGTEVYFIDDDDGSLASMVFLARSAGMTARGFSSPLAFLEAAPQLAPGCVVTDVRMPDMDGIELLQRVRRLSVPHRLIVVTGHGDEQLAEQARRAGAIRLLEKPFAASDLLSAIEGVDQAG